MANNAKQLALASEHLRAGNPARAGALCRKILKNDPDCAAAWRHFGIALAKSGDLTGAATVIVKAIHLRGPLPQWCADLGHILNGLGRHVEAASCFRQALSGDPLNAEFSVALGSALTVVGQFAAAVSAFEHAAELDPVNPDPWFQLGYALYRTDELTRAGASYDRVLEIDPKHAPTHFNLGVVRMAEGRYVEAESLLRTAIRLDPGYAEAHNNIGLLYQEAGRHQEAEEAFRSACRTRPGYYGAEYNLARVLFTQDRFEQARDLYEHVVQRCPQHLDARLGLGNTLAALARPAEAIEQFQEAVEISPGSVPAHFNLGIAMLQAGQWEEGWPLYEWRYQHPDFPACQFDQPRWDGASLTGRRILIEAEQGLGDTLQFSRYVPMVRERGGRVTLECQSGLTSLLGTLDGVDEIVQRGDSLPEFDVHASPMSLPAILGTTPETVPCEVPYLLPDREQVEVWSERLLRSVDPGLLRVGLAWAGNPDHKDDRNRSIAASSLNALAGVPGVAWFNLQKEARGNPPLPLLPLEEQCMGIADTAAAILCLDLVISVDTAVAHLAGALGKPVWTLLSFAPDWRWMLKRSDTPWYPTMRLFRQPERGDWTSVLASVRNALEQEADAH